MSQKLSKRALFAYFTERFSLEPTTTHQFFDELTALAERELRRCGEFSLPGLASLLVQHRKARVGRNPATGETIHIPPRTAIKVRIASQLKRRLLAQALSPSPEGEEQKPDD